MECDSLARTRTKGQPACGSVNDLQQGLVRRGASLHLHDAADLVGRFWLDCEGPRDAGESALQQDGFQPSRSSCCAAVAQLRQNDAVAARTPEATGQPLGTTGSYRELLRYIGTERQKTKAVCRPMTSLAAGALQLQYAATV